MKIFIRTTICLLIFSLYANILLGQCEASFTFGETDITIQFTDLSTSDPGDPIVDWLWDFEDGTTSTEQHPLHTFPEPGVYDVLLTITTQSGCTSEIVIRIETCAFTVNIVQGECDGNDNITLTITVNDIYDNAKDIDILVDGDLVPGSPFEIDAENPVTVNYDVAGDGLPHTIDIQSTDIGTCSKTVEVLADDCGSNCFLGSLAVNIAGGQTHNVDIGDDFFSPQSTTIVVGDLVHFIWVGDGHSTTSDATSGDDSWNSGVIGQGSTYDVNIKNPGVHPYYCIPHGGPGGSGMSGSIVANCPGGNSFTLDITFNATQTDPQGYNLYVDGILDTGSPYNYNGTGPQSVQTDVAGDGAIHTIEIEDVADPSCIISKNWTAPDCGEAPQCSLSLEAIENGACDGNNNVPVELTVSSINNGNSGFNVFVDGIPDTGNPHMYTNGGTTIITILVPGDGTAHSIEVTDVEDSNCTATFSITTTNCTIPCSINNLMASTGSSTTHVVFVEDFVFNPANITISDGDIIEWQWTGDVNHTTTSDAETGPDSWDSGLLGTGATYQSPVLSTGIHPYYCIPHGGPGGTGMAGTITVQANCTNDEVSVTLTFNEEGGSFNGFEVLVDGLVVGTFNYDPSGTTTVSVNVAGDGQSHTIEIVDADDPLCTASTTITTPDCNAPTCQLTLEAVENGSCDGNDNVPVDLTITDLDGGVSGFEVYVDGTLTGTYDYDPGGTTMITINVSGDGQSHTIEVIDIEEPTCSATATLTTSNCAIPCSISNLMASTGSSTTHVVFVEDFVFNPANITISDGDIVEWQWTGAIDHTTTSDAETGPDSWDSGLLGTGATYQSPVLSTGIHPYYCIPHGGPGGTGMAGTITVQANCTNNEVSVTLTFNEEGGSFNGFEVLVDGLVVGTFNYDPSGTTTVSVNVAGDGQSHTIEIVDADDPLCTASTTITTPDCNAPTCQLTLEAVENGSCDGNDNVPVDLTITDLDGGVSGFEVYVDGTLTGTYDYDPGGTTMITINVSGDGQSHTIEVIDIEEPTCSATATLTTSNCAIPCSISNLMASTGSSTTHVVFVEDFVFNPANITISDGDIVEWQWTGAIDHTTTSDAETGPDSWDSGLLGTGATYQSPVLSTGIHPYYCIPHGGPGGTGMAGTITVQANCTNNEVSVTLTFNEEGGSFNGFEVLVDGLVVGTFNYDPSGTTTVSVNVAGDGQSHTIEIVDADDPLCTASTTITTPDCNAPTCQLTLEAVENGSCDGNDNVPVDLTITDLDGGVSGFEVYVDGTLTGTYDYDPGGTTMITINVSGDGQSHTIEVIDIEEPTCSATATLTTSNCAIPCSISNLMASTGSSTTHIVFVEDFVFNPANITISDGDIVEWQWTGAIDHTTTSDAETGPDSWDSGLLGTGATYQSPVLSTGIHPYYCIPHGGPGGTGMAGTITVQANCTNDEVSVTLTFNEEGGSFNGFEVLVDGLVVGTFNYDPSGTTTVSVNVAGDGQSHTIEIVDADDPLCTASTTITTPDCNAPTCQLTLEAVENGSCDGNDNVPVDLTITDLDGGVSGFEVYVDGTLTGTYDYDPGGTTMITINVSGDGQSHTIEVIDIEEPTCSATATLTTSNCAIPCSISNLMASTGSSTTHVVFVEDFVFNPANITISDGDIVEWQWTGAIDHTTTSDAETGPDSWDSGLLGTGATYQSPVLSTGIHPYYCIPHGGPGGTGMAGTITVQANCTNDEVSVTLTFNEEGGSFNGFEVLVDGLVVGTFNYDPSGTTTVSVNVAGDGQSHTIEIVDADDPLCTASTTITTPDCNAPTCQLTLEAVENGSCDGNDNVPVDLTITDLDGGVSGFEVYVDGTLTGTYDYDPGGTTMITINVSGDGQSHTIEVIDIEEPTCSATATLTTSNCAIPCSISNLMASTGSSTTHVVFVEDFVFNPANITISDGDIVEWQWTGAIDHTTTSDAETGPDSWDSGLLGTGATYQSPVLSTGIHPYYCIPHGGPGGTGMAGTITVQANCTNDEVSVTLTFNEEGGSFNGFEVLVDGLVVGTFNYDPSGTTTVSVNVAGDGQSHTIEIVDADDPLCTASTTITTPDCNAPTCQLTLEAVENGSCDGNDNVPVDLTITDLDGGVSGFEVYVDGTLTGTYDYDPGGTTMITINVSGDGQVHSIEVKDIEDQSCTIGLSITTSNCTADCLLSNLILNDVTSGNPVTHTVEVLDFEFLPKDITVNQGDSIHFVWNGVIAHTATTDTTSGPDSWDSGLLGQGATFDVSIQNQGVHPYYCIPHGGAGGIGMAGTITAVPPCNNGEVTIQINFEEENGGFSGYNVYVDGSLYTGSPFTYDNSGFNNLNISIQGDGQTHSIEIEDVEDATCSLSGMIEVTNCSSNDPCSISVDAAQVSDCDQDNQVIYELTIDGTNTGNAFNVLVDGNVYAGSPFNYNNTNPTVINISITGTGLNRLIEIQDVDSTSCVSNIEVATPLCGPVCEILNMEVSEQGRHFVEVKDFEFFPKNIDVLVGDTVEFFWTGVIPHTATTDATSGPDSWDSGLLGQGATFEVIVQEEGLIPYYCIPHGGPGGIGMAGTINALPACDNGTATLNLSFETTNGSVLGYNIFLDGTFLTGPIMYDDPMGYNSTLINVPGDMETYFITVQDLDIGFCAATISFIAPFCEVLCEIQNLQAMSGSNIIHEIEVKDFVFEPQEITVRTGETVKYQWTGVIPHTATSDVLNGPDAFDSGLLGQGEEYSWIFNVEGEHPYYCIPHGGPGGIGMAGIVHALPECENGEVAIEINFSVTSGSPNGYNIFVDGNPLPDNPIAYDDPAGSNSHIFNIVGDGQTHLITVQDIDVPFCAATTQVEVIDCSVSCNISGLSYSIPQPETHIVEVLDFEFTPSDITINLGDTVRYVWIGQIPHTATSDDPNGVDAFDSGLLELGATFDVVLTTEGVHSYYCIPHGAPGGVGMAGTITVLNPDCENGLVSVNLSFMNEAGSPQGFNLLIDGIPDQNNPYLYDLSGLNQLSLSLPGDGLAHEVIIQDTEDVNCGDTLLITTINCSSACELSAEIMQSGDCDSNNEIPYTINVFGQNTGSAFIVNLDGFQIAGSPFDYENSNPTTINLTLPGDGMPHLIEIADMDSTSCSMSFEVITTDCSPDCLIDLDANQISSCDNDGNVDYEFEVYVENSGSNGFILQLDGASVPGSPFAYDGPLTTVLLGLAGDGNPHEMVVVDLDFSECTDTLIFNLPDCSEACAISDFSYEIGVPLVHVVEVRDFDFEPKDITIEVGDTVRWIWTGVIPHTATSDTINGVDSWNSGLLGEGAVYDFVISNVGYHPYYCIPHGSPGGIGMAGSITAVDPCEDETLNVAFSFSDINTGLSGYNVFLDGIGSASNPYNYAIAGTSTFTLNVTADGQQHDLSIQDVDAPDCRLDTLFQMPSCNDPCFGFEALFNAEINHQTLEVNFFCQTPDVIQWQWTFGDGAASTVQNPVHTYSEAGDYEICVEVENAAGCMDMICEVVSIGVYQCEANFTFENEGLTVTFFDQSNTSEPITNWTWSFGDGVFQSGVQNPIYTYDTLGIYEACLTIDAGNCTADTCMLIDLSDPCLAFNVDFVFTIDEDNNSVQFADLTEGEPDQWLWGFGDGNTSNDQNPEHFYDEPGTYNVCLLVQNTTLGCNSSFCQSVNVGVTSVNGPSRNQPLTIFPNPADADDLTWNISGIQEKDNLKDLALKVYDLSGKTILERSVVGYTLIQIDLNQRLTRSIYFIELKGEETVYRGKVVVQ